MALPLDAGFEHALRMTREQRFSWNSVTKKAELDRVGKDAVRLAIDMELEREQRQRAE